MCYLRHGRNVLLGDGYIRVRAKCVILDMVVMFYLEMVMCLSVLA